MQRAGALRTTQVGGCPEEHVLRAKTYSPGRAAPRAPPLEHGSCPEGKTVIGPKLCGSHFSILEHHQSQAKQSSDMWSLWYM